MGTVSEYLWGVIIIGRNPRVEFAGAFYHVIQRGNNQEPIFEQDKFKRFFMETLQRAVIKYGIIILGYVIMNNHYHLLIQVQNQPLSKIMHLINGRFAQFYNWWHNRKGHVFQGRYKAYLVQDERYLLTVLRYIHQNPLRARITENVSDYWWSSDYYYRNQSSDFVDTGFILNILSDDPETAVVHYRELMGEPVTDEEKAVLYQGKKHAQVSVDVALNQEIATAASQEWKMPHQYTAIQNLSNLDLLLQQCCVDEKEFDLIKSGSRSRILRNTKLEYVKLAREAGYTIEEIGANISMTKSAVMFMINTITA